MKEKDNKYIFGTVKVGEKGQIVIPKEARDIFDIKSGDSLMLLGDINQGLALIKNDDLISFAKAILNGNKEGK